MPNTVYVNVSGTWKQATNYYVNVNGTWKTGTEFQANVSNVWKGGGTGTPVGLPHTSDVFGLGVSDFLLPTIGTSDVKASINSHSLDLSSFVLPSVGHKYTTAGVHTSGTYYPMFAIDTANYNNSPSNTADPELSFRRMLSFDTSNTTDLNGTETLATIKSIVDTSGYACDSSFGNGGHNINGIKIKHYQSDFATLEDECEFTFSATNFNIYDDACNAVTNANNSLPTAVGTILTATVNGTSVVGSYPASDYVFVNSSTTGGTASGNDYWSTDQGDYCFLGVTDRDKSNFGGNSDSLDTSFASNNGIAFGISDSDGRPSSGQTPREGISRRSSYPALVTNWQSKNGTGHSGRTISGYFIVYGKVV